MPGFLEQVTPLVLTLDEMPNIERTFARLTWARSIVVVDSGSKDGTVEWLERNPRVRVHARTFHSFAEQADFGLRETGIRTPWVLSLDADHVLSEDSIAELDRLAPTTEIDAYEARFTYCVGGRPIRSGLYPPRVVLARRECSAFVADGHAHRLVGRGRTEQLVSTLFHDDRKPRDRFLRGQARYAREEAEKLTRPGVRLGATDRVRRLCFIAPWLVPLWCLVVKGGLLDGRRGWIYAGERAIAEWLIAMAVLERRIRE